MSPDQIWVAVVEERGRQRALWAGTHAWGEGDCSSHLVADQVKAVVLAEECGEVARAVLDQKPDQLRTELVQVAAICVAWLESM